jgi:transposase InsO family protein
MPWQNRFHRAAILLLNHASISQRTQPEARAESLTCFGNSPFLIALQIAARDLQHTAATSGRRMILSSETGDWPIGLRCRLKRRFKATTNSQHDVPVAENLLNQTFSPTRPNEAWVSDITYVPTDEGWLYLAGLKDVFTCELVGYAMGARMKQGLTVRALRRAARNKKPPA